MPTELAVHAVHRGDMRVVAGTGEHSVMVDYPMTPGQKTEGLTSLQLLLAALASCAANTMALLLRKVRQPASGVEVEVRGRRRDEHPTIIIAITMEIVVHGSGLDPAAVARAYATAEEQLCPVWAMLKAGTPVSSSYRIVAD